MIDNAFFLVGIIEKHSSNLFTLDKNNCQKYGKLSGTMIYTFFDSLRSDLVKSMMNK